MNWHAASRDSQNARPHILWPASRFFYRLGVSGSHGVQLDGHPFWPREAVRATHSGCRPWPWYVEQAQSVPSSTTRSNIELRFLTAASPSVVVQPSVQLVVQQSCAASRAVSCEISMLGVEMESCHCCRKNNLILIVEKYI